MIEDSSSIVMESLKSAFCISESVNVEWTRVSSKSRIRSFLFFRITSSLVLLSLIPGVGSNVISLDLVFTSSYKSLFLTDNKSELYIRFSSLS